MKRIVTGAVMFLLACTLAVSQVSLLNEATNGLFRNVNDFVIKPNIMFNTVNADVMAEYAKATQVVNASAFDFAAFADAVAALNVERPEDMNIFAWVNPADMAAVRKALKDDLKYVEAFSKHGYVGTVCGVNLFTNKLAEAGTILGGVKEAVKLLDKKGMEVEQERDIDHRENTIVSRKYYVAAMVDETKAFKIVKA